MSEVHLEDHSSLIKTPQQLIVVVVLAFVIPVVGIVMIASAITGGLKTDAGGDARAVAQRLEPVGSVMMGDVPAPVAEAQPAAAAIGVKATSGEPIKTAAAGAPGAPGAGKKLYDTVCMVCHAAGIAGAPKTGDKAAWKSRIATGKEALYTSALRGKNAMPAKGGSSAADADVKAAVDYMIGLAK